MEQIQELLIDYAKSYQIELDQNSANKFQQYMELLLEWNQKMNLTAIKEPKEVAVKHFLDSLTLLTVAKVPENAKLIDVGTGAGFPGVPLKMVRNDINLTLLDSLNKRLTFLQTVCDTLQIKAEIIHARAEEGGRLKNLREKFDIATARAVAPLNLLCEYCLPFVKKGGNFIAMKGPNCTEEVEQSKNAIALLGGKMIEQKELTLPDGSARTFIIIEKINPCNDIYPRHGSKISKNPL